MEQIQYPSQQYPQPLDTDGMFVADDCFWPRSLLLSTASKVWRKQPGLRDAQKDPVQATHCASSDYVREPCIFCGFVCDRNETHHINDNHQDQQPENLGAICTICHLWQHLAELPAGDAYLCYLPGLSPQDANHLLRTLLVALESDDGDAHADAHALLNWMASHRDYVEQAWGSHQPGVFASALLHQSSEEKEWREISFADLALVIRPGSINGVATAWRDDTYRALPANSWPQVYHSIMNAPL